MTKTFNVIEIEDYGIAVDDFQIKKGDSPCYCYNSIKSTWDNNIILYQGTMPEYHYIGFKKIIGSIGKRLDGVPLIELVDNVENLVSDYDKSKCPHFKREHTPQEFYDVFDFAFTKGYKANTNQYSEKDMINFLRFFLNHKKKEISQKLVDANVPDNFDVATEVFKLYQPQKQIIPTEVELEMETVVDLIDRAKQMQERKPGDNCVIRRYIDVVEITNKETNTITAVNYKT